MTLKFKYYSVILLTFKNSVFILPKPAEKCWNFNSPTFKNAKVFLNVIQNRKIDKVFNHFKFSNFNLLIFSSFNYSFCQEDIFPRKNEVSRLKIEFQIIGFQSSAFTAILQFYLHNRVYTHFPRKIPLNFSEIFFPQNLLFCHANN